MTSPTTSGWAARSHSTPYSLRACTWPSTMAPIDSAVSHTSAVGSASFCALRSTHVAVCGSIFGYFASFGRVLRSLQTVAYKALPECRVEPVPELRDELQVSEQRPQQAGVLCGDQARLQRDAEALLLCVHLSAQQQYVICKGSEAVVLIGTVAAVTLCKQA